jgi:DNA ligase (NAD+)
MFFEDPILPIREPADIFTLEERDRANAERLEAPAGIAAVSAGQALPRRSRSGGASRFLV